MTHAWIWLSILAAFLQTLRTAAQRQLSGTLSTLTTTYVRALLGLPPMLVYLGLVLKQDSGPAPHPNLAFLGWSLATALTQNAGTAVLLSLYRVSNFAVANQLARTDLVFTAIIGVLAFSENISGMGWLAIAVTLAGALMLSGPRGGGQEISKLAPTWRAILMTKPVRFGLIIGFLFGVCNLTLREASLSLGEASPFARAAVTVATVTAMQTVTLGAWLHVKERGFLAGIVKHWRISALIGLTSAVGSICWFTAFSLTNASYVRAVGQIEAVFGLIASIYYFRERITQRDLLGIALTLAGVVMFRVWG